MDEHNFCPMYPQCYDIFCNKCYCEHTEGLIIERQKCKICMMAINYHNNAEKLYKKITKYESDISTKLMFAIINATEKMLDHNITANIVNNRKIECDKILCKMIMIDNIYSING